MRFNLSSGEVHADAFAQDELHLCWVAELQHGAYDQVDPLVWSSTSTQLRTLVNRGVPGGLSFHLQQNSTSLGLTLVTLIIINIIIIIKRLLVELQTDKSNPHNNTTTLILQL